AAVILAHAGGSTIWVFSTTLLQEQTEDRYRGSVFSADYALHCLVVSAMSYAAGLAIDLGAGVRAMAAWTGALSLLPALLWASAQRYWRESPAAGER
ncbi:MAG: MFS transporter, partial [Bryobacteraceae bacterium]